MLERQRERIAKAKADGKYKGRKPSARMKKADALALLGQGVGKRRIVRNLGISERSVYRITCQYVVKADLNGGLRDGEGVEGAGRSFKKGACVVHVCG
ncbi:helix-turn-helix domain-containing protein [Rhodovulum visakhapatnamense]